MGILGKLTKMTIDIITTPVAIVKDVVTLGGAATGAPEPYTKEQLDKITKTAKEIYESLDD